VQTPETEEKSAKMAAKSAAKPLEKAMKQVRVIYRYFQIFMNAAYLPVHFQGRYWPHICWILLCLLVALYAYSSMTKFKAGYLYFKYANLWPFKPVIIESIKY
jgi:hypothetical protein